MNYYEILGVSINSSQIDIKKAYHKQAIIWHPDKNNNSEESKQKFQQISEAYQVLHDVETRKEYDTHGKTDMKMKSANIFAPGSQSSAIVRDVRTTTINGITKAFLDLIFVNGDFNVNEEIIASDYITGEELCRTRILPSVVGVVPTDGGITQFSLQTEW